MADIYRHIFAVNFTLERSSRLMLMVKLQVHACLMYRDNKCKICQIRVIKSVCFHVYGKAILVLKSSNRKIAAKELLPLP